jgi:hypothetical protein
MRRITSHRPRSHALTGTAPLLFGVIAASYVYPAAIGVHEIHHTSSKSIQVCTTSKYACISFFCKKQNTHIFLCKIQPGETFIKIFEVTEELQPTSQTEHTRQDFIHSGC